MLGFDLNGELVVDIAFWAAVVLCIVVVVSLVAEVMERRDE